MHIPGTDRTDKVASQCEGNEQRLAVNLPYNDVSVFLKRCMVQIRGIDRFAFCEKALYLITGKHHAFRTLASFRYPSQNPLFPYGDANRRYYKQQYIFYYYFRFNLFRFFSSWLTASAHCDSSTIGKLNQSRHPQPVSARARLMHHARISWSGCATLSPRAVKNC